MHLFHHHPGPARGEVDHTCYHCGRQFLKRKGVLHRLKHEDRRHCPACHFEFEDGADDAGTKPSPSGGPVKSRLARSLPHPFSSSRHKKTKLATDSEANTTAADASSFDSADDMQLESRPDADTEKANEERKVGCSDEEEAEPCPFSFTYETEDVESYQLSCTDQEVESYQLGWLLTNVS